MDTASPRRDELISPRADQSFVSGESVLDSFVKPSYRSLTPETIRCWHWVIFVALDVMGPFTGAAFGPLLPDMCKDLNTSDENGLLAVQLGLISKAFGQLIIGELSDRFGRRPILIVALLFYTASLAGCGFVTTLAPFLVFRIIGGFCEGTALIPVAIARDVWDNEEQRAKSLALIIGLRPLMLMASPAFGGVFGQFFGWRPLFWLEGAVVAGAFLMIVFLLPETLRRVPADEQGDGMPLHRKVCSLITSRLYVGITGFLVLQFCTMMAFGVVANFVFEEYYGMTEAAAGGVQVLTAVGGVLGAVCYKIWAGLFPNYSILKSLRLFLVPHLGMATFMVLAAVLHWYRAGWGIFVLSITLLAFLSILQGPPGRSLRVQPFPEISGLAVGFGGFFETLIPTGVSFIASSTWDKTKTPESTLLVMGVSAFVAVVWFVLVLGLKGPVWTPPPDHKPRDDEASVRWVDTTVVDTTVAGTTVADTTVAGSVA